VVSPKEINIGIWIKKRVVTEAIYNEGKYPGRRKVNEKKSEQERYRKSEARQRLWIVWFGGRYIIFNHF
jgi:hypothetical protein